MTKLQVFMATTVLLMVTTGHADVLIIDRINHSQDFAMPERGSTMTQVLESFGEPQIRRDATGEPPITVWQYDKFSVYFERQWVINTVVLKATPEEKGPKGSE